MAAPNPQVRIAPSGPLAVHDGSGSVVRQIGVALINANIEGNEQEITEVATPVNSSNTVVTVATARIGRVNPGNYRLYTQVQFDVLLTEYAGGTNFTLLTQVSRDEGLNWTTVRGELIVWPISQGPLIGEEQQYNSQRVRFCQAGVNAPPWDPNLVPDSIICRALISKTNDANNGEIIAQSAGFIQLIEIGLAIPAP